MSKNTIILIDGSNYFYRAYHAMSSLSNSEGMPTGAIYGMTNMLKSIQHEYQPAYAAVTFDSKEKNFRHQLYPDYKANRQPMPAPLAAQISSTQEMVQALGFSLLTEIGVEADDVIGTLAKQAEAAGMSVLIFTGDKDFAQLVNTSITITDTMRKVKTRLDAQGVQKKFGVPPELIIDYLALIGDKVDNIPGVNTVGPKTAIKWLKTYGNLDAVIEKSAEFKGKVGDYLREAIPHLPLTRQLLTIKCDVPLSYTPQQLKLNPPDIDKLRQLYSQFEFNKLLDELPEPTPQNVQLYDSGSIDQTENNSKKKSLDVENIPSMTKGDTAQEKCVVSPTTKKYQIILAQAELDDWLHCLTEAPLFAFDIKTNCLDYLEAQIVGVSLAVQTGEAAYLPIAHDYLGATQQLSRDNVLAALKPLLENPDKPKIGHNLKYHAHILANHGIQLQRIAFDTMLESYILNSTATHNLDELAQKYLQLKITPFEDIAGKGKKQLSFNQIQLESAAPYAAELADITWQLHEHLWHQIQTTLSVPTGSGLQSASESEPVCNQLPYVFSHIEMPLVPVLIRMERHGVKIAVAQLHQQSTELKQRLQIIEKQTYEMAGSEFNLNSPKQLQTILFDQLGLPVLKKRPKKNHPRLSKC